MYHKKKSDSTNGRQRQIMDAMLARLNGQRLKDDFRGFQFFSLF